MARPLVVTVVFVFAVAGSSLGACTSDEWYPVCNTGEGPGMSTVTHVRFSATNLTCTRHDTVWGCTGECCHIHLISESEPVGCDDPCIARDEVSCASDARCWVARDFTAFYSGAGNGFLGCFPHTSVFSFTSCELRSGDTCAFDGTCIGLYNHAASDAFVECVHETPIAGSCTEVATCSTPPPACPSDRTPGVAAGCFTGACIPNDLCAP